MAESILRTQYGFLGQWVEEVRLLEGMKHGRTLSCLGKYRWLGNREKDEERQVSRQNHKWKDAILRT